MSCNVKFVSKDGREFKIGRFNEGKRTDTEIAYAAAKKIHNLIKKLECGGHNIVVQRDGGNTVVPCESFFGKL